MKSLLNSQEKISEVIQALDDAVLFARMAGHCFERIENDVQDTEENLIFCRELKGLLIDVRSQAYFAFHTLSKINYLSEAEAEAEHNVDTKHKDA